MRVHHLNCGSLHPDLGRLVSGRGSLFRRADLVCHVLLVETEQGLVLVDSGIGLADAQNPPGSLGRRFTLLNHPDYAVAETAIRQVERLGYAPADVRHVILTHLDLDHAGGIRDFPGATVHVAQAELDAAVHPRTRGERYRYRPAHWAHGPKWATYPAERGESWFGFEAVRELTGLPPEILLVPLAGHTRGHTGVAVDTGSGWLLHAGDAYFFHGEVATPPRTTPGLRLFQNIVEVERAPRLANQRRLRELVAAQPEVRVFSAHDPVELRRDQTATATA